MCSAAWKFHDRGYELGFNRDEKWIRPASADPLLEKNHVVPGACARDSAENGSWLFTNVHGITLAVMNAYPHGVIPVRGEISRGMIPFLAAAWDTSDGIENALRGMAWEKFSPCHVLLVAEGETRHFEWNGNDFSCHPPPLRNFLTTSSVRIAEVSRARTERFDEISNSSIPEILSDTTADDAASSIYVKREDGGTVSQTSVNVGLHHIRFTVRRRGETLHEIVFPRRP